MSDNYKILKLLTKSFEGTVSAFTSEDLLASRFKKESDGIEDIEFYAKHLASLFQDIATSTYTCVDMSRFLIIYFCLFDNYNDNTPESGTRKLTDMLSSDSLNSKEIEEIVKTGIQVLKSKNFRRLELDLLSRYEQYSGYNFNKRFIKEIVNIFPNKKNIKKSKFYASDIFTKLYEQSDSFIKMPIELLFTSDEKSLTVSKTMDEFYSKNKQDININQKTNSSKAHPHLSVTLINDPEVRGATQNNIQFQVFMNSISTIEFSRCIPYMNIRMILPELISSTNSSKRVKSASISQFLFGNSLNVSQETTEANTTEANMSLFTMPQTLINLNDKIGHKENHTNVLKITTVHDPVRPFLTLNSLDLDVVSAGGLMSYKAGNLSLILHDKTRMTDIAPFIKPDLLGMHGAEIEIEYGWSHPDGYDKNSNNVIGKFLNLSRTKEKYQISNSTFTIGDGGVVNIELKITMHGPSKLSQIEFDENVQVTKNYTEIENIVIDARKRLVQCSKKNSNDTTIFGSRKMSGFMRTIKHPSRAIKKLTESIASIESMPFLYDDSTPIKVPAPSDNAFKDNDDITLDDTLIAANVSKLYTKFYGFDIFNETFSKSKMPPGTDFPAFVQKTIIDSLEKIKIKMSSISKTGAIESKKLAASIVPSIDFADPFNMLPRNYVTIGDEADDRYIIAKKHISFGAIFTGLIGQYILPTNNFDDVQIISYTANANAGSMRHKNIFNFLIEKEKFNEFLEPYATKKIQIPLSSFIASIVSKFIEDKLNNSYGISDVIKKRNNTKKEDRNKKNTKEYKEELDEQLRFIYGVDKESKVVFKSIKLDIKWDTLTNDDSNKTILKISIFDKNDDPFESITSLMNDLHDLSASKYTKEFNKKKVNIKSVEYDRLDFDLLKHKFYEKLRSDKIIEQDKKTSRWMLSKEKTLSYLKTELKKMYPSVTYGTERTALKSATVSSVNDHQMQAIYMTRNGIRRRENQEKDKFLVDLPIKVIPSTMTAKIFGCPWVNFNQHFFLDFETGTTLDNVYFVVGIKHSIKPGSFNTELRLAPGDVYGKYENTINTLNEILDHRDPLPPPLGPPLSSLTTAIDLLVIQTSFLNNIEAVMWKYVVPTPSYVYSIDSDDQKYVEEQNNLHSIAVDDILGELREWHDDNISPKQKTKFRDEFENEQKKVSKAKDRHIENLNSFGMFSLSEEFRSWWPDIINSRNEYVKSVQNYIQWVYDNDKAHQEGDNPALYKKIELLKDLTLPSSSPDASGEDEPPPATSSPYPLPRG